jgi:peroxiredoxin (alkyl hydroperoxide reductase subunit C)
MNNLVGKNAPEICLEGVDSKGNFIQVSLSDKLKKYEGVVLFFYPLNFTFVCPTELIKLHEMFDQFHDRRILLLGINTDSKYSHAAWRNVDVAKGGLGEIGYTLLSDYKKAMEFCVKKEE